MEDNYPDDIRNYDDHPLSPFYIDPWFLCKECDSWFDAMDMANENYCRKCAEHITLGVEYE